MGAVGEGFTREANVTPFSIGNADRYQGKEKRRYTTTIDKRLNMILYVIQRKLLSRSDRVKSVDLHPTEPWVLASLYNGHVYIYNYETQVRCLQQLNISTYLTCFSLCNLGIGQDIRSDRNTWWVTIIHILDTFLHAHYFIHQCELPSLLRARIGLLLDQMIHRFAFSTTTRTRRWQALKDILITFVAWQFIQHNHLFYPDLMT